MPMIALLRCFIAALLSLAAAFLFAQGASAAETLRVGKAVPEAFSFVPLDIGMRKGLFANNSLDIEAIALTGDARMQQAMASDSLDVALGSGPAMAFIVKGAPIKAVAAMAGPPLLLAIVGGPTGPRPSPSLGPRRSASRPLARSPIGSSVRPRGGRDGAPRASRSRPWARCRDRSRR